MAQDAVATLEATREKLIHKLLEKKRRIDEQLKGPGVPRKGCCGIQVIQLLALGRFQPGARRWN
jgi:hypothetical protein